ncbi:hypothetical protein GCM10022396_30970 [Flavivirga amylovorans]
MRCAMVVNPGNLSIFNNRLSVVEIPIEYATGTFNISKTKKLTNNTKILKTSILIISRLFDFYKFLVCDI